MDPIEHFFQDPIIQVVQNSNVFFRESPLIDGNIYIRFYADWLHQTIASLSSVTMFNSSGSMYIGLSLYINGMVQDLKKRIEKIDVDSTSIGDKSPSPMTQTEIWLIYVKEMDFHMEIIE